jgi:hypothetical protein
MESLELGVCESHPFVLQVSQNAFASFPWTEESKVRERSFEELTKNGYVVNIMVSHHDGHSLGRQIDKCR